MVGRLYNCKLKLYKCKLYKSQCSMSIKIKFMNAEAKNT